jgi:hypothetical protein
MRVKHVFAVIGLVAACGAAAALAAHPRVDPATVPTGFLVAHNQVSKIPVSTIARAMRRGRSDIFIEHVRLAANEATTFHAHPAPVLTSIARGSVVLQQAVGSSCPRKTYRVDFGFVVRPRRVHRIVGGPEGADYYEVYLAPRGTGTTVRDVSPPAACGP